jgi:hypothetical protein
VRLTYIINRSGIFVTNKSISTGWLRARRLPMLLSLMLIALAAMQGLHDQFDHDALGSAAHCEFCLLSQNTEGVLIPFAIIQHSSYSRL